MNKYLLKKDGIEKLINALASSGGRFIAPGMEARQVAFKEVRSVGEMARDYILPRNSYKERLFPQTEAIAGFTILKNDVTLSPVEASAPETVIFGARPCEAASQRSLKSVFTWGSVDESYTKREDRAVVITIACTKADDACFCTTVGLSPETKDGSDIYLMETESGDYAAEAITEKGAAFAKRHGAAFEKAPAAGKAIKRLVMPEKLKGIDLDAVKKRLSDKTHYDDPLWAELSRKCIGCGACTYSCPTCHCFDIIDEGGAYQGERRKNWDSCQFDHFTLHASGHNPRDTQYKRWRNRFMCKFHIYPTKFSSTGCVGCGRCVRVCPVRLDITEVMEAFSK